MNRIYEETGSLRPGRSMFDLSHNKIFDVDIGKLVPVLLEDVQPGDIFEIAHATVIRAQPLVTPIYHKINAYIHYFFVPYRILWKDFTRFWTGGSSGDTTITMPMFGDGWDGSGDFNVHRYSLWDYFGFPIQNQVTGQVDNDMVLLTTGHEIGTYTDVNDLPWRAYWAIWRDYYRDSNHMLYYPDGGSNLYPIGETDEDMLDNLDTWIGKVGKDGLQDNANWANLPAYRCWQKDYFTSALPWQQRGTAPAVPLQAAGPVVHWPDQYWETTASTADKSPMYFWGIGQYPDIPAEVVGADSLANAKNWHNNLNELSEGVGIDIADLRYAVQIQKWMERSARGGWRYNEQLKAHFGVSPTDERLQRPEYIGGAYQPIVISEVLQSSETTAGSPQGNMAGHAMSVSQDFAGKYRVTEHGCIMGIMSIMPEAIYQQGIPRQWTKQTKYDFYSPEFAHLSEQEIKRSEIYWRNIATQDQTRFGFQGAWDEYRQRNSIVCGKIASDLKDWTLSRIFTSAPSLNSDFLTLQKLNETRRDAWAVSGVADNQQAEFLVQFRNIVKAIRPMPYMPEPGMMDHF